MSKCRKCHLRETKFAKFPGGACPQTPLEARAVGARLSAFGANRASLFLLKRGWNVCGSIFLLLSVNVFSTKVLIGTLFLRQPLETGPPYCVVFRARESLAACSAVPRKYTPSFLSYFKTPSIGPAPGIKPATSAL